METKPRTPEALVEDATSALRERRQLRALESLLEAFRLSRAPAIADAIDKVSTSLDATSLRPKGKTVADRHETWLLMESERNTTHVAALLATFASEGKREEIVARFARIEKWPADPRVAMTLARILERPRLRASDAWYGFWSRAMERLAAIGDVRVLRLREGLERHLGKRPRESKWIDKARLARLLDELTVEAERIEERTTRELRDAIARLESELAGEKGTAGASIAELYSAVYESPADDAPRLVLGDALLEAGLGDPRGELIAAQLGSSRSAKREKQIVREHVTKLLGPLAPVVVEKLAVFERGFLSEAAIHSKSEAAAKEVVGLPEWATVRVIHLFSPKHPWQAPAAPLLSSPVMRSLREVTHLNPHTFTDLTDPLRLTRVHLTPFGPWSVYLVERGLPLLPELRELDFGGIVDDSVETLATAILSLPAVRALDRIAVGLLYDEARIEWARAMMAATIAASSVALRRTDPLTGWSFTLRRDEAGELRVLEGEFVHGYRWSPWESTTPPLDRAGRIIRALGQLTSIRLTSKVPLAPSAAAFEGWRASLEGDTKGARLAIEIPSSPS